MGKKHFWANGMHLDDSPMSPKELVMLREKTYNIRKLRHITQEEASRLLGMTRVNYWRLEHGGQSRPEQLTKGRLLWIPTPYAILARLVFGGEVDLD